MKCNCPSEGYLNWQVVMHMEFSLKQKRKRLSKQPHVCFVNCNCVYVKVMYWLATFARQEVLGLSDRTLSAGFNDKSSVYAEVSSIIVVGLQ